MIARRLHAAAVADFVVALHSRRADGAASRSCITQAIFLAYRDPQTPVAIIKSKHRQTAGGAGHARTDLAECEIGMSSTVLIGNSTLSSAVTEWSHRAAMPTSTVSPADQGRRAAWPFAVTGLVGWRAALREDSGPEVLAARFRLPRRYLRYVLGEPTTV